MNSHPFTINPELAADLERQGADIERTLRILALIAEEGNIIRGSVSKSRILQSSPQGQPRLPQGQDPRITDFSALSGLTVDQSAVQELWNTYNITVPVEKLARVSGHRCYFSHTALSELGIRLYPYTAYGVLNGGSATTYVDTKKNTALSPRAFELFQDQFTTFSEAHKQNPKGITSAYFELDGSGGPSFLLLKMRSLLIRALEYRLLTGDHHTAVLPFFQMTSDATDAKLTAAYEDY
ncbi:MAG: hypothetical protein SNJ56_06520, partial [Termitinemataceae bacterium]